MPRKPRIEIPGGFYHLGARGNARQPIFDDPLRGLFVRLLDPVARTYGWVVFAWALMTNHYHLIIQLGDGGLSDGMHDLNTGFARASNARFGRRNHAFGERFWDEHIETDRHLRAAIPYVLWNPARRGVGRHPVDSPWTSFRGAVGLDRAPPCLARHELLGLYGNDPQQAVDHFSRAVADGRPRAAAWQATASRSRTRPGAARLRA